MLGYWWSVVLDCIYPPRCPVCRTFVGQHGQWCRSCAGRTAAVRYVHIAHTASRRWLDACLVVCQYRGAVQKLIRHIKFGGSLKYEAAFTWLLVNYVRPERLGRIDCAIPVPLHHERLRQRGYNQVEKIYHAWVVMNGWQWDGSLLTRSKSTPPLWDLRRAERRRVLKGAFDVKQPLAVGASILLLDDIFTSGATMDECAKMLKRAGAGRVTGLAFAGDTP